MRPRRLVAAALVALATWGSSACVSQSVAPGDPLLSARKAAMDSTDGEVLGKWLLEELLAPGGSNAQARQARARLDDVAKKQQGLYASIARGLDDESHGSMASAARAYVAALEAARTSDAPETPIVGWFVVGHLMSLRPNLSDLWKTAKPVVEKAIAEPGALGFRARTDLVNWWLYETRRAQGLGSTALERDAEKKLGCITDVRFAGPFGKPAPLDVVTSFEAEKPGPWPSTFKPAGRAELPRVRASEGEEGVCAVHAADPGKPGIYYVETFVELDHDVDVLVSIRAAWSIFVDDVEVLSHDPRAFGTWATTGVAVHLTAGRHRILGRLGSAETFVRVLDLGGREIAHKASTDASAPYVLTPPKVLADPQALAPFWPSASVSAPKGFPALAGPSIDVNDPVLRAFAAELSHSEGNDDLATVLVEPLVKEPSRAAPLALSFAANYIESDPVFAPNDARDLALDYRKRATDKDARLWYPQLWLLIDAATKQGEKDQLAPLGQLVVDFPEVAMVGKALANLYGKLGYRTEQKRAILDLERRFPQDIDLLRLVVSIDDEEGRRSDADQVAKKIEALEPSSSIAVERAISRDDLEGAAKILEEQAKRAEGQNRKRLLRRVAELLVRGGKRKETLAGLEQALSLDPSNAKANLELADARYALGDHASLRTALAHALRVGSDSSDVRDAIEVVDGMTELEPFRMNALDAIHDFEKSGAAAAGLKKTQAGTAARVLDYSALWIHANGSARMLEHEVLFMQSPEAIRDNTEQKIPRGKLLKIRVIKADGRTFEPELVGGKPTATMPHLEVGDYIETETIYDIPSDGNGGKTFLSPRWQFREEKVDYYRSEFVVISPKQRPLVVETTGTVPKPEQKELGEFVINRWRVDKTAALPNEPFGAPAGEFLPTVRVGWGITQNEMLSRLLDASVRLAPTDPRLVRIARTIVTGGAPVAEQERVIAKLGNVDRAKRLYRWVLDNIEPSRESDPRRSVVGKSGSRIEAFLYLCRLVGVDVSYTVIQDRATAPAAGPFTEAELFTQVAVAIPTGKAKGDDVWTVVDDKYAPFGYIPSSLRGQPAVILRPSLPRVVTGTGGPPDGVVHKGKVVIAADGSARLSIDQSYTGKLAIILREQIQKIPDEEKLRTAIESELLPGALPGARVRSLEVRGLADLDDPLVLHLEVEVSGLAKRQRGVLVVAPPFAGSLTVSPLAALEKRETPIVFPPGLALRVGVELTLELPKGAKIESQPPTASQENDGRTFKVADHYEGATYVIDRVLDVPAGRVSPDRYEAFAAFARAADQSLHSDIIVRLP